MYKHRLGAALLCVLSGVESLASPVAAVSRHQSLFEDGRDEVASVDSTGQLWRHDFIENDDDKDRDHASDDPVLVSSEHQELLASHDHPGEMKANAEAESIQLMRFRQAMQQQVRAAAHMQTKGDPVGQSDSPQDQAHRVSAPLPLNVSLAQQMFSSTDFLQILIMGCIVVIFVLASILAAYMWEDFFGKPPHAEERESLQSDRPTKAKSAVRFASGSPDEREQGPASGVSASSSSLFDNLKFFEKVDLFKRLPNAEMPKLAKACSTVTFQPGAKIITQGDEGDELFIIKSGTAKVEVNGNMVATLKAGDYFGENALLHDDPRTATITCQSQISALKISRDQFVKLGLQEKLEFAKRGAVGGGAAADAEIKAPSDKTLADIKLISAGLKSNANLNNMITLDDAKLKSMTDLMWIENVAQGTKIITEGDLEADYFYVVASGSFEVTKKGGVSCAQKSIAPGGSSHFATLCPGTSFGELALLYFSPRGATITATEDSNVFVLARQQFKQIITQAHADIAITYIPHLNKVTLLDALTDAEKKQLAEALTDFAFSKNERIFDQGEKGVLFYLLIDGEVSVVKDGKEVTKLTATNDNAPAFGEMALMSEEVRSATIKVTSDKATTLAIDKKSFEMLIGPLEEVHWRGKDGDAVVTKKKSNEAADGGKRFGNIFRKDLKCLGLLGCGGFGAVEMVEHAPTGDFYALKALSKGYVLKTGMQSSVISEKNVQLMCDSPFVVKLYETYNSDESLYLLLELALGGELYATYNKKGLWGHEACAKFYLAGTVFAFEHLHDKKIIFRDLKPENLLLNEKGQVKLTDMGLAKVVVGKTYTTCGTPDYFAPELIASKGHTEAVDWWTLGILNFELLGGHPPFESESPTQIYQKVTKGINNIQFPNACKGKVETLIKGNLHSVASERLPMKKGGTRNIKSHEWYEGFDWKAMQILTMEVPYKPAIKNNKDITNFSAKKEDMPPQVRYKDPKTGWDNDFATST